MERGARRARSRHRVRWNKGTSRTAPQSSDSSVVARVFLGLCEHLGRVVSASSPAGVPQDGRPHLRVIGVDVGRRTFDPEERRRCSGRPAGEDDRPQAPARFRLSPGALGQIELERPWQIGGRRPIERRRDPRARHGAVPDAAREPPRARLGEIQLHFDRRVGTGRPPSAPAGRSGPAHTTVARVITTTAPTISAILRISSIILFDGSACASQVARPETRAPVGAVSETCCC